MPSREPIEIRSSSKSSGRYHHSNAYDRHPPSSSCSHGSSSGLPRPPSQILTRKQLGRAKSTSDNSHDDAHVTKVSSMTKRRSKSHDHTKVTTGSSQSVGGDSISGVSTGSHHTYWSRRSQSDVSHRQKESFLSPELMKQHIRIARCVIEEMNREMSRSSERRIASITNACEEFDHWETEKHDIELLYGAAVVLTKLLINTDDDENELRMILAATEMVFRASPKAISNALQPGKPTHSLSQQLIKLWDYLDSSSMEASQHSISHADISTLNIAKIIHSISRCTDLRTMLLQIPALLEILIRETELSEEKVWRMRILANIANHEDCKVIIFEYHGILEFVLRAGHFETNDWSRQYAAKILMELSSSPANQISMAKIQTVLGTLVKMVFLEKSSDTRKSAISCLQNLAFTKENRIRLVQFKNGLVLEALKKSMTADLDEKARRRAAGTLTNIACAETAEALGTHKGLLETLAIVVTKDPSLHVQSRAALALTKIACFITVDMTCHEMLLDALVAASLSKAATTVSSVLRVKARAPENRQALARHPGIMDTLCDWICSNGSSNTPATTDRDNAVRAIMHLVNDETNRKTLCNKTVLAVLVQAANYEDPNLEEARDSAIRALQRLATDISNRHTMGHFEGLITAIAKAAEREAHWEQIGQETEYGCLAKPLLMTLLISM